MPPPDGFETCRRIKANPLLGAIPVMFMTGLSDTAHVVEGLRAGGVDCVTTPIMLDELIARIHVHIANARMLRRAQAALDVTGRRLVATDAAGGTPWSTPLAAALVAGLGAEGAAAIAVQMGRMIQTIVASADRKSTRLNSSH